VGKAPTKKPLKAKSAKPAVRSTRPAARAAISAKKPSAPVTAAKAIAKPVAKTSKPAIELKPKAAVIETKKAVVPAKGFAKSAPVPKASPMNAPSPVNKPAPSGKPAATLGKSTPLTKSAAAKNHAPPVIVAAPVPTDGKPRKNQAGIGLRDLEHFRELLLAKRRELLGDMSSMEREALRATGSNLSNLPIHMADMGTDNYEQEFTLGLVEKDRQLLREINTALAKIQDGSYGLCEGTGKPISKARLEAQPWAKYSIEHARELEKRGIRR
jgi:RNA polymerase-binding protein DksA